MPNLDFQPLDSINEFRISHAHARSTRIPPYKPYAEKTSRLLQLPLLTHKIHNTAIAIFKVSFDPRLRNFSGSKPTTYALPCGPANASHGRMLAGDNWRESVVVAGIHPPILAISTS
jgi:hypothetical protein